ncbi:ATP-binding protein [Campylobacter sp.]|uniref:ATP-binding protein n=1 Tax=Campylobacter sp. TaxID=205 RepID=UPI0027094193|nr:HAMP domain-containing sensor histidine kinase [Campylobacter sp.]
MQKWIFALILILFFAFELLCCYFYRKEDSLGFILLAGFGVAGFLAFLSLNKMALDKSDIERAFAKTPNLGLLLIDKEGVIKFINKKFEQIFNLESKVYYEQEFDALVSNSKELELLKNFSNLKNHPHENQNFVVCKDKRFYRLNISSVLESGVKFDGLIITASDVTHEKELEEKEAEHHRMLIANAKTAVVGEMINSISHQQRQPLSSILLSLENIEDCLSENKFDKIRAHLNRCKNGIRLMDETISAFRSFYKNDNSIINFNVKDVINELTFIVKPQMNTNGILFEFECEDGEFIVYGVPSYVKQILLSLLSNAKDELVNFMQDDIYFEPRVWVGLQNIKGEICISVSDNGGGVKGDKERIFEPFFTTKKDIGTGMGLYVAKILATDKLGGRLVLESAKEPTKFALYLKRGVEKADNV